MALVVLPRRTSIGCHEMVQVPLLVHFAAFSTAAIGADECAGKDLAGRPCLRPKLVGNLNAQAQRALNRGTVEQ